MTDPAGQIIVQGTDVSGRGQLVENLLMTHAGQCARSGSAPSRTRTCDLGIKSTQL